MGLHVEMYTIDHRMNWIFSSCVTMLSHLCKKKKKTLCHSFAQPQVADWPPVGPRRAEGHDPAAGAEVPVTNGSWEPPGTVPLRPWLQDV